MSLSKSITSDLLWIGAVDAELRIFDIVMETEYGTTYNSYLLKGSEKTAIFETVKSKFFDSYCDNLKQHIDPASIDYIIINHTEPDHTGALYKLLELAPHAVVVGSSLAIKYLGSILNTPFNALVVKDGDALSLGNKTIRFINVPLLHWPDTMYSYIEEDGILVTCDSYGAHYATDLVFYHNLDATQKEDYAIAFKYYYDMIMGPFKPHVLKALDKTSNLTINAICPSHGVVLDGEFVEEFKNKYLEWSTPIPSTTHSIVIPYVSAYGYTEQLAYAVLLGVQDALPDASVKIYDLSFSDLSKVTAEVLACDAVLIGSSTLLADTLPQIWQLLISFNPIIHAGKYAACFGSYGWSSEATKNITERFKQLKFKQPLEPFTVCFKPTEEDLKAARAYGYDFAKALPKK